MDDRTIVDTPLFPEVHLNLVPVSNPVIGRIVSNQPCTKGKSASFIKHTEIDVTGTPLEGKLHAGQSFGVIAPGRDERGRPHKVRLYSLACPRYGEDGAGRIISTTPKRVIEELDPCGATGRRRLFLGVCSNYLCDLMPGDEVQITGPNGKRFLLPTRRADHDYVLVATGTGIAPFRGMVQELLQGPGAPCPREIHLIAGAPYTSDLLYDDLFRRLAAAHPNFQYHTAISRETRDGATGQYVDHVIEARLELLGPLLAQPSTLLYICGIAGMQVRLYRVLAAAKLDRAYFSVKARRGKVDPPESPSAGDLRPTARCLMEVY